MSTFLWGFAIGTAGGFAACWFAKDKLMSLVSVVKAKI